MDAKKLLELLNEPVVVNKLEEIIMTCVSKKIEVDGKAEEITNNEQTLNLMDETIINLQNNIAALKKRNEDLLVSQNLLEDKLNEYRIHIDCLSNENGSLKRTIGEVNHKYTEALDRNAELTSNLKRVTDENAVYEERIKEIELIVSQQQSELEERFSDGWDLYVKYKNLGSETKQLLTSVFPRESFESFISGGAKDKSLEKIWDETSRTLRNGDDKTAYILWDIFTYFLNIVNEGKTEDVYQINEVSIGDNYDKSIHSIDIDSRVQGVVTRVFLPGYSNIYNGSNVRKSIVRIG